MDQLAGTTRPGRYSVWGRLALVLIATLGAVSAHASTTEIKVATIAPDGSHWLREMRAGAERIRQRTDGRVEMRFYPGGVMGNDSQVLRRMRVGQLQAGAFTSGGLGERYSALNLYGIPLLFRSLEEVDYVRERLDPLLQEGLERAGFVSFGFVEGGFAELMSNQPVRTPEDLRRRKVWVPEGDQVTFAAMDAMGLSPVVLPVTDVLTGLQTGLLDVVGASPVVALVMQWHTRTRYITNLPVSYSMGVFAIDARTLQRLTAADQAIIREEMTAVMSALDEAAREDNQRAREVLKSTGLQYVEVDHANVGAWREIVETTYPHLRRRPDIDAEVLDRLLSLLAMFRAEHEATTHAAH